MNIRVGQRFHLMLHILLLCGFGFMILTSVSPHVFPLPNNDQGVYTYIARGILDGKVPYRDIWDHKGPLVYYLYAAGLLIHPVYGVWFFGLLYLSVTIIISYRFFESLLGRTEAFFGTLAWLAGLRFLLDGGNTVEFYNLLFQFGCLFSFLLLLKTQYLRYSILIGALSGLSFLFRPNEIGVLIAISLQSLLQVIRDRQEIRQQFRRLMVIYASFSAVITIACLFLYVQGAFSMFVDAFIHYNLLYTQTKTGKLIALFFGIYHISPLFILAISMWIFLLIKKRRLEPDWKETLLQIILILFPLQIWLATLSNQPFAHYFISWMPAIGSILAFGLHSVIGVLSGERKRIETSLRIFTTLTFLTLTVFTGSSVRGQFSSFTASLFKTGSPPQLEMKYNPERIYIEYIISHTNPDDYVWIWGNEVIFNVQTDRRIPSRLIYPYPLGTPGYPSSQLVQETIRELKANPPVMILDRAIEPLLPIESKEWEQDQTVLPLIEYIRTNYSITEHLGPDELSVWMYNKRVDN